LTYNENLLSHVTLAENLLEEATGSAENAGFTFAYAASSS